jgi:hypothetical protein
MILNSRISLLVGPYEFAGTLDFEAAPISAAWLMNQLPLKGDLRHACWSGEAAWLPLAGAPRLIPENATSHPRPGQILLYAGAQSQAELLIPYGDCAFASKAGTLAGSPVAMLRNALDDLHALGTLLCAKGMQSLTLKSHRPENSQRKFS